MAKTVKTEAKLTKPELSSSSSRVVQRETMGVHLVRCNIIATIEVNPAELPMPLETTQREFEAGEGAKVRAALVRLGYPSNRIKVESVTTF